MPHNTCKHKMQLKCQILSEHPFLVTTLDNLFRLIVPTWATSVKKKKKQQKNPPPKLKLPDENIKTLPQSSHLLSSERYSSFGVKL